MASGKRTTITRDSVFRSTGPETERVHQGVAPAGEAPTRQTAVWLADEEVEWLDKQAQDVRRGGWRGVSRSALIRALIRAAMQEPIDLTGASGESELADRLRSRG